MKRAEIEYWCACHAAGGHILHMIEPVPPRLGDRFFIPDGDGDQKYFGKPMVLTLTVAPWFPGRLARGDAKLFKIENGDHAGEYLVLTSRAVMGLDEQISRHGYASVVVHQVTNPTVSFDGSGKDASPIGMASVWHMDMAKMFPNLDLGV